MKDIIKGSIVDYYKFLMESVEITKGETEDSYIIRSPDATPMCENVMLYIDVSERGTLRISDKGKTISDLVEMGAYVEEDELERLTGDIHGVKVRKSGELLIHTNDTDLGFSYGNMLLAIQKIYSLYDLRAGD